PPSFSQTSGLRPDMIGDTPAQTQSAKASDADLNNALASLDRVELHGSAAVNETHDRIGKTIDSLVDSALQVDPEMEKLNKAWFKYKTPSQKAASVVANALNYGLLTRGDMPSSEAGDVILHEKLKLKSRGS